MLLCRGFYPSVPTSTPSLFFISENSERSWEYWTTKSRRQFLTRSDQAVRGLLKKFFPSTESSGSPLPLKKELDFKAEFVSLTSLKLFFIRSSIENPFDRLFYSFNNSRLGGDGKVDTFYNPSGYRVSYWTRNRDRYDRPPVPSLTDN